MTKKGLGVVLALALACSSLVGCGGTESKETANTTAETTANTNANTAADTAASTAADTAANTAADTATVTAANTVASTTADTATESVTEKAASDKKEKLPEFRFSSDYPPYYNAILDRLMADKNDYDTYDVMVPGFVIFKTDDSDANNIKVYGEFMIYHYSLDGKNLKFEAGGATNGAITLKKDGDEYIVTDAKWTDTYEEIEALFEGMDDVKAEMLRMSENNMRERERLSTMISYVQENKLDIESYEDYGFPKVMIFEVMPGDDDKGNASVDYEFEKVGGSDVTAAGTSASAAGGNDLAQYSSVIDALNAGQHYAIVSIRQGEGEERMACLLVAGGTFNYQGSEQAAIDSNIYYVSKNGEAISAGKVHSTGSNYPLAVSTDGYLMYYYDKVMKKVYVDKESGELVVKESAGIKYSKDGNAAYSWYSSDTGEEIAVPDDEKMNALMDEYIGAETVSFKAGGVAKDGTPKLSGAVYSIWEKDNNGYYKYYVFKDDKNGNIQSEIETTPVPFTYEQNGDEIIFHVGNESGDEMAVFSQENDKNPVLTFKKDGKDNEPQDFIIVDNADAATFDVGSITLAP